MTLKEKQGAVALVTGASAGIGRAFAERLARDGFDLILVARRRARLEELQEQLGEQEGSRVEIVVGDLTKDADLQRVEALLRERSEIDMLVNNAGLGTYGRFAELAPAKEAKEVALNVVALHRLMAAAIPPMIARGRGTVINVSSMAGFQPVPFNATYGATKAFVTSFTEALYEEVRGTGVRVQALCPGFTRTEFHESAAIDMNHLPSLAWMSSEQVVASSLASLERGGVIHVPGLTNRVLVGLTGLVPRSFARRVSGMMMPSR